MHRLDLSNTWLALAESPWPPQGLLVAAAFSVHAYDFLARAESRTSGKRLSTKPCVQAELGLYLAPLRAA